MNIAVILAGGGGNRAGGALPKQFWDLAGKTVVERAIAAFDRHPGIDEIAVVISVAQRRRMEEILARNPCRKSCKILLGGKERFDSTLAAYHAYESHPGASLLFHDAARPRVSQRIISDVVAALRECEAVNVAVPAVDSFLGVNSAKTLVTDYPDRNLLQRGQSPQAFRVSLISKLLGILKSEGREGGDICAEILRRIPSAKIHLVKGEESNMKLTYNDDIHLLETWVRIAESDLEGGDQK
ncbi:MAG: 2-C-methyl-D-erythritol 4-phosphate cytidylyltransferase [Puniceicoccales bacterium]|nr:2-C-methyl-D-erythritol 4-phosphate cytidylyltransferase [Puniceicoccales bacterium]